jgi:hypothetical protein
MRLILLLVHLNVLTKNIILRTLYKNNYFVEMAQKHRNHKIETSKNLLELIYGKKLRTISRRYHRGREILVQYVTVDTSKAQLKLEFWKCLQKHTV